MMAHHVDFSSGQLPLKGVVLCCTALPQDVRTTLAEVATQMGAVHKLDLTSEVTHLIVGSITTPKYQYVAKERPDIKVLHPDWLEAVRVSWMEGGDVDVEALENEHRFPPFTGLHICLTGFANIEQRDFIERTVQERGAEYHGDLTKIVTHLIAAAPEGEKYTFGKRWGIPVVSLKWLEDSLERGMALDPSYYDPMMPAGEQGKGAFRRYVEQPTSLGKHGRENDEQSAPSEDLGRKKLRRTASSRLEGHSQDMWSDISAATTKTETLESDQWNDDEHASNADPPKSNTRQNTRPGSNTVETSSTTTPKAEREAQGLFSGHHVLLHGFDRSRTALLGKALQQNGATVVQSPSELDNTASGPLTQKCCVLVPHESTGMPSDLQDLLAGTTVVTEWWVERCIYCKQLLNPADDVLSRPLGDCKVSGFSNMVISTTGFVGVDLRQVAQTVNLIGATYQEQVLPSTTVIIAASASIRKEKAYYASKHSIPVVSSEWLWTCLKTKKMALLDDFKLTLPAFDLNELTGESSTGSPAVSDVHQTEAGSRSKRIDDAKRLSNSRKRHATPSLPLKANSPHSSAILSNCTPAVHEDDDELHSADREPIPGQKSTAVSQTGSQPLQDLSPNLSPRKNPNDDKSRPENDHARSEKTEKPPPRNPSPRKGQSSSAEAQLEAPQPAPRPHHEVTADLAELLNHQRASRPSSAAPAEPPQSRRNRPLGRASSGISNRSHSFPLSAHSQSDNPQPFSLLSDVPESVSHIGSVEAAPMSTQLGYDTPEAEAHRLQMGKKMGTKLQDDYAGVGMQRVASVGIVKDSLLGGDAGVGNRVKARKGRT